MELVTRADEGPQLPATQTPAAGIVYITLFRHWMLLPAGAGQVEPRVDVAGGAGAGAGAAGPLTQLRQS